MFSSFSSFSNPLKLIRSQPIAPIPLDPVPTYEVETIRSDAARTLKHLLKLNHAKQSILYNKGRFHNHLPHILGSAYILGSDPKRLNEIYEEEAKELEGWYDSPGEVSSYDWRDYLGNSRYQRAYVDFFEDELVLSGYDWKKVVSKFLFEGKEPLVNNLVSGLGHPLIHLGYAFELANPSVAMEALGLSATCYNFFHKYLDDPAYTPSKPPPNATANLLDILETARKDTRLTERLTAQDLDVNDMSSLFSKHEAVLMEHWNAWLLNPENAKAQFEQSQRAAAAALLCTHDHIPENKGGDQYDFFFVHLLTTSHAVRILLPVLPAEFHISVLRQWWLLTLAVYITQGRPEVKLSRLEKDFELKEGRDWEWVNEQAVRGQWYKDAHFVKAMRALKVAGETWGDEEQFWLKGAVKLGEQFDGWGFGE